MHDCIQTTHLKPRATKRVSTDRFICERIYNRLNCRQTEREREGEETIITAAGHLRYYHNSCTQLLSWVGRSRNLFLSFFFPFFFCATISGSRSRIFSIEFWNLSSGNISRKNELHHFSRHSMY